MLFFKPNNSAIFPTDFSAGNKKVQGTDKEQNREEGFQDLFSGRMGGASLFFLREKTRSSEGTPYLQELPPSPHLDSKSRKAELVIRPLCVPSGLGARVDLRTDLGEEDTEQSPTTPGGAYGLRRTLFPIHAALNSD